MIHAGFVKRILGVKRSVPQYIALKEAGQFPMHFYWFKSVVKFWNSLVKYCECHPGILRQVVNADLNMTRNGKECWCKEISDTLECLYSLEDSNRESLASNLYGGVGALHPKTVDWTEVRKVLLSNHMHSYYNTKSASSHPREEMDFRGRKNTMYQHWMSTSWDLGEKPDMHHYLKRDLPHRVIRNMARFRTSSHYLKVETDRWKRPKVPWKNRVCDLCDLGVVQDEHHVVFECREEVLLNARHKFQNIISQAEDRMVPMQYLMNNPRVVGRENLPWFIDYCTRRTNKIYFVKTNTFHND